MKEKELRKHATCSLCGKKIGRTGLPMFWTVTAKRWDLDMDAIRRQQGLAMMLGHAGLAQAMGPDEDMAKMIYKAEITVCEDCAISENIPLAAMAERATNGD